MFFESLLLGGLNIWVLQCAFISIIAFVLISNSNCGLLFVKR
jgi:hypothetical protein